MLAFERVETLAPQGQLCHKERQQNLSGETTQSLRRDDAISPERRRNLSGEATKPLRRGNAISPERSNDYSGVNSFLLYAFCSCGSE